MKLTPYIEENRSICMPLDVSSLVSFASSISPTVTHMTEGSALGMDKDMLWAFIGEAQEEERRARTVFDANAMGMIPMAFVSLMVGLLVDSEVMDVGFLVGDAGGGLDQPTDFFG